MDTATGCAMEVGIASRRAQGYEIRPPKVHPRNHCTQSNIYMLKLQPVSGRFPRRPMQAPPFAHH
jgi:hypothetical protein